MYCTGHEDILRGSMVHNAPLLSHNTTQQMGALCEILVGGSIQHELVEYIETNEYVSRNNQTWNAKQSLLYYNVLLIYKALQYYTLWNVLHNTLVFFKWFMIITIKYIILQHYPSFFTSSFILCRSIHYCHFLDLTYCRY